MRPVPLSVDRERREGVRAVLWDVICSDVPAGRSLGRCFFTAVMKLRDGSSERQPAAGEPEADESLLSVLDDSIKLAVT